jgi:hypothetical protein
MVWCPWEMPEGTIPSLEARLVNSPRAVQPARMVEMVLTSVCVGSHGCAVPALLHDGGRVLEGNVSEPVVYGSEDTGGLLEGSVRVASMLDTEHDYLMSLVVDAVQDTVGAAPRGPDSCEVISQGFAHTLRVADQGGGEKVDDCCGDGLGKLLRNGALRWGSQNELVFTSLTHGRRARAASMPRRTSPRA